MNRRRAAILPMLVCLLCALGLAPVATEPASAHETKQADAPAESPRDLLARAESAFEKARSILDADPADTKAAAAALDESIAASRAMLELGIENASIHRNIGTAYMLRGDVGRAIAAFRRAERIDPTDPRIRDSLAAARARVRTAVTPGTRSRVEDALLFWRGRIPRGVLLTVGLAGWAVGWLGAMLRLFTRRGAGAAFAGAAVATLTLGSLLAEHTIVTMNPAAVIVQDNTIGYRGPSESVYTPTFEEPIHTGVEAVILETRDGWARLRLRSGAETWVPDEAIEKI